MAQTDDKQSKQEGESGQQNCNTCPEGPLLVLIWQMRYVDPSLEGFRDSDSFETLSRQN